MAATSPVSHSLTAFLSERAFFSGFLLLGRRQDVIVCGLSRERGIVISHAITDCHGTYTEGIERRAAVAT